MFTRKPRLRPGQFSISDAKRLLQHNRPQADIACRCYNVRTHGSRCMFGPRRAGRLTGPAFEGMRKGGNVSIAKQPCYLRNHQVTVGQVAVSEVGSKTA